MLNATTYADLNKALSMLGFERQEFEGKHYVYVHEATDTWLTFPILDEQMRVRPVHLITTRKMVLERGIAEHDTFERLLLNCAQQTGSGSTAPVTAVV